MHPHAPTHTHRHVHARITSLYVSLSNTFHRECNMLIVEAYT